MGCMFVKVEDCIYSERFRCVHPRVGCFVIATISVLTWIAISLYFLLDEGVGFFNAQVPIPWISRCYICGMLIEAVGRVGISIVLIIACARNLIRPLKYFLVVWLLLFVLMIGNLTLAIIISQKDGGAVIFNVAYATGRLAYSLFSLCIVNSYRLQLQHKIDAEIEAQRADEKPFRWIDVEVM